MTGPSARLHALVRERRSLRAFAGTPLRDHELALLFEAARWAPSAGNGQPWRFVATRQGSDAFVRLANQLRPGNAWARGASVLVLTAARRDHVRADAPPKANRLALLELGLALGNLIAQATALGIVAHPLAGFDAVAAGEAADVPHDHEVAVIVALGRPGDPAGLTPRDRARDARPRTRLPLAAFVFEERFGASASFAAEPGATTASAPPPSEE